MKLVNRILSSLIKGALLTGLAVNFNACSEQSPLSSQEGSFSTETGLKVLQFNSSNSLKKLVNASQLVTVQNGGNLVLEHGSANGQAANFMYANDANPPYNVYRIDPSDASNPVVVGQLAFKTNAIALHPFTGKVNYVGVDLLNGVYPVGVWDPKTNTNTILPSGSPHFPNGKLAFHPDGTLFGVKKAALKKLQTIDTTTGQWTVYSTLNFSLGVGGDMIFSPDGSLLYSTGGNNPILKVTDIAANFVTNLNTIGPGQVSGLFYGKDGNLYYSSKTGELGIVDQSTGVGTAIGSTGLTAINDMAPFIASTELTYANISLNILPGTISEDAEVSLEIETTELAGGVAVTFEPHGVTFSSPAILNIDAHGLDFTGVDPNTVDVYYDNPQTGQWELMQRDDLIVDANAGTIQVINAQLPHFSRYAIGAE